MLKKSVATAVNNGLAVLPPAFERLLQDVTLCIVSPEQREVEQEEGSESREESQDSPIASGDDIQLYDNQISPGLGEGCMDGMNYSPSSSSTAW